MTRLCIALTISALLAEAQSKPTYFVAPDGNDAQPGTQAKPFRSVGRAQDTLRALPLERRAGATVFLRGGVHQLDRAVLFDARDSGTAASPVTYRSFGKETAVFSGGRTVTGWVREANNRWRASVDVMDVRQFWVNGKRAARAGGALPADIKESGHSGYATNTAAMLEWRNPEQIELLFDLSWQRNYCRVHSIVAQGSGVLIRMLEPYFTIGRFKGGMQLTVPTRIENALELLDEPGEFYYNRKAKVLYYLPRPGEDMTTAETIVPVQETLMKLDGTLDHPVESIRFEQLAFRHGAWFQPSELGFLDMQANFTFRQTGLFFRSFPNFTSEGPGPVEVGHPFGEAYKSPANVVMHAAHNVRFERCEFSHLGGAGLDIEYGSADNLIVGNRFFDIAGSAIQVGDVIDHHPEDARMTVRNNRVLNNYIHHIAQDYLAGMGVFVGYPSGTVVAHNEIAHLPYSGISMGWGWGEADQGGGGYWQPVYQTTPTTARDNLCERNYIHHVMQERFDGAGIYTLGNMPGSIIRGNHIHDARGWPGGIYLDEGSGHIEVTGNLIYALHGVGARRRPPGIVMNNRRQNRIVTCRVHDNLEFVTPEEDAAARKIAAEAGLEPAYRDLLEAKP